MSEEGKHELAIQVGVAVLNATATLNSPGAGAIATVLSPFAVAGLQRIFDTLGSRRKEHVAQTLLDGAEAFGAKTEEDFATFLEAAICDEEHQELLARALTIAQDTAMRDKHRALGRALAAAACDIGTKVDAEILFIRVLADLDEPHIRLLRVMSTVPPHLAQRDLQARQWYPWSIVQADPGLTDAIWSLFGPLERHRLVWSAGDYHVPGGAMEPQYEITQYGDWFLTRLAEPE
jgi:hypothetical protein